MLARPGAGVDPASFQDYKPGGARKEHAERAHFGERAA